MEENTKPTNPLLDALRIPGATFRLPSQGLFYEPGVLDTSVKNGEVEVYPMTAMDEIILSTPDKLLSGKALMEVFRRTIPQVLDPAALLSKDVDYLMVCLRSVSFGPVMTVGFTHDCEHAKENDYDINLDGMIRRTKQIDPTSVSTEYTLEMQNGQKVTLKPLTYGDVVDLYQTTLSIKTDDLTQDEAEQLIVDTMVSVIASVDGVKDKAMIREWVCKIPLGWKKQIEKAAQDTSQWGVDFTQKAKCKDCGKEIVLETTANPVSFFT